MNSSGKFRVVHVTEDVSAIAGGVPAVVHQLSRRLADQGILVQVVHATGNQVAFPTGIESFAFPSKGFRRAWSWGEGLKEGILRLAVPDGKHAPLFHLHGIWSAPHYFAARIAHDSGIPFVVTAHGMLEPWLWKQQGWPIHLKKKMYWKLFGYPALKSASVVHAITPMEREHLHTLFPKNRIEIIPNAIDMKTLPAYEKFPEKRERLILFLGRIEPKKGVDILLHAFANAKIGQDWQLAIIGPVWAQSYRHEIERIIAENKMGARVTFLGHVFGEEKIRWLRKAWIMAVPSHSEVIGLVNLEAAANLLPTITTHQTGLYNWESGGGILIQPVVEQMRAALEQACAWSDSERNERGFASQHLVSTHYSWDVVLPQWISLYESLATGD